MSKCIDCCGSCSKYDIFCKECLILKRKDEEKKIQPFERAVEDAEEVVRASKENKEVEKAKEEIISAMIILAELKKNLSLICPNYEGRSELEEPEEKIFECCKNLDQKYKDLHSNTATEALNEAKKVLRRQRIKITRDYMNDLTVKKMDKTDK